MTAELKELKTRIALDRIVDLEETRDVRTINRDHVERLAVAVDALPPIDVVRMIEGKFGILAGYHRREAHRLAGRATIRVVVHHLDTEQWFAFAVRSNLAHGLPLTMAERKAAAQRMLKDGDRRSDRAIAADCGLDHKTVGKLREAEISEETTGEFPQLRVGLDGKARRVPGTLVGQPPRLVDVPGPPQVPAPGAYECEQCGNQVAEGDEGPPVYDCGECAQAFVSDEGNRCPDCNRFAGKVADASCPECEGALFIVAEALLEEPAPALEAEPTLEEHERAIETALASLAVLKAEVPSLVARTTELLPQMDEPTRRAVLSLLDKLRALLRLIELVDGEVSSGLGAGPPED